MISLKKKLCIDLVGLLVAILISTESLMLGIFPNRMKPQDTFLIGTSLDPVEQQHRRALATISQWDEQFPLKGNGAIIEHRPVTSVKPIEKTSKKAASKN